MSTLSLYKNFINEADEPEVLDPGKGKPVKEVRLMKLFISKRLEELLRKMIKTADFQAKAVANQIVNIDLAPPEDNLFQISYLDIDPEKEDSVTFMPAKRAWDMMGWTTQAEADQKPAPNSELWTAKGRQSLGVGKLINKLFDNFKDIAIAKFVDAYKAEIAATMIYDRFKLISGEEIRKWYAESSYFQDPEVPAFKGNLGQSCMRYDGKGANPDRNCQPYFDIYCKNPPSPDLPPMYGWCSMLILTNGQNKLLGRAIVWFNLRKPEGKTFMDRIYVVKQSDEELFKKYAQEHGWLYKYNQKANDYSYVENGQRINKSTAVRLREQEFKYYPFMDTLKYYTPKTGRLGSDAGNPPAFEGAKRLKLENGNGTADRVD